MKDEKSEISELDFIDFVKSLHILEEERDSDENGNLIKILLYTSGGCSYLAFAFYDAISACRSPVEIRAIGQCMSAGTLILQAADYRYAYPNTTFMVHKGSVDFEEMSISDAEIEAAETRRMVLRQLDIYEAALKMSRKTIEEMLARDTFMDAQHAKRIGLIDGIKERFDN
jgi:ATP-dependent Clp protease protease subunit